MDQACAHGDSKLIGLKVVLSSVDTCCKLDALPAHGGVGVTDLGEVDEWTYDESLSPFSQSS